MNPGLFPENLSAVIPAAGLSSRMHRYKPLLKLGDSTMAKQVITLFQQSKIKDIIVVTGHNREKIEPLILGTGARPVFNPDYKAGGMLSSIQAGVRALPDPCTGFFLLPVDIPSIRPPTVRKLIESFSQNPDRIIIPEFDSKPGHPPLIPGWVIPKILSLDPGSNLGRLLSALGSRQKKTRVHDRGILMDADTPEAYNLVRKRFQRLNIPDREECMSLILSEFGTRPENESGGGIIPHLILVAETAVKIALAVMENPSGAERAEAGPDGNPDPGLDLNLIRAGALLHDIKKKEKDHARAGKRLLLSLGFPETAEIVGQHTDLEHPLPDWLTETQVVYFADKICGPGGLDLDYSPRFKKKIARFPWAEERIVKRHELTRDIQTRIETICGRSVRSILGQE
ncbi:DVU_1551 family NTP transferase [Desulfospira joergensenii]|uniref:DVU_1551 family NTP transferase n=1 Tax=Desulfospira joergensenii TaxID=53329 RepID=UPI0003B4C291|nr:NTP transferase domain-containing protein [Desulfospira joergensenii]